MVGYKGLIGSSQFEWRHGSRKDLVAWGADQLLSNREAERQHYRDGGRVFGPDQDGYPGADRFCGRGHGFDREHQV